MWLTTGQHGAAMMMVSARVTVHSNLPVSLPRGTLALTRIRVPRTKFGKLQGHPPKGFATRARVITLLSDNSQVLFFYEFNSHACSGKLYLRGPATLVFSSLQPVEEDYPSLPESPRISDLNSQQTRRIFVLLPRSHGILTHNLPLPYCAKSTIVCLSRSHAVSNR